MSGFRGSNGALIVSTDKYYLLVDGRYEEQARSQAKGFDIVVYDARIEGIVSTLSKLDLQKVSYESNAITVDLFNSVRASMQGHYICSCWKLVTGSSGT